MKFKNYIETGSGIKDTSTSPGTAGQVLSSTVTGTSWIDPDTLEAAASKLVVISCKNVSGAQILKGTPVYQSGTVGATDVIEVEPADATISTGYLPAIGILQTTLNNNGFGNVVITGEFLNYSTADIPTDRPGGDPFTGDTVYLAAGGGLTCIKPTGAGNAIQNMGLIGKVSGGNSGSITVASIMRANDVPNLPEGRIWIGDGNTIVSDTVYVDEPNGRVGIGTTSPLGAIQIGDLAASSPSTNQILVLSNIATTGGNSNLYLATGASGTSTIGMGSTQFSPTNTACKLIYSDSVDTLSFHTNFSTKMVINGSGNVGIGTTNPLELLHISSLGPARLLIEADRDNVTETDNAQIILKQDGGAVVGNLGYKTDTNGIEITNQYAATDGILTFGTSGTERIRVKHTGEVGVNTTSPYAKLTVASANGSDVPTAGTATGGLFVSNTNKTYGVNIGVSGSGWSFIQSQRADGLANLYSLNLQPLGGNVGIGTTSPSKKLEIKGNDGVGIRLFNEAANTWDILNSQYGRLDFVRGGSNVFMRIDQSGNVGIGTTNPGSKLEVGGEIDASGGDGYRINGKPWANESSNILRLGDWDGEGFSTSIFDENTIETFKVKDEGVIINCDRTKATSYGSDASLVVGGSKFATYGPGVVTLLNNDPFSQAGDSTGLIQFAIRDDQSTSAGYTSASIKGSIDFAAGTGSSGGGILDFLTSAGALGSSPTTRMRINRLGNVGIGTTSPQAKLQVNGGVQLANDTAGASASKVGTFRYRTSGNNSYVDMCMQTGASTYAWVNIVTNSW